MKSFLSCYFLLILLCGLRPLAATDITSANQALASGHAAEALADYQSLLASPQFSKASAPELWYDCGLAQKKIGDPIAASLSFRRALLLDPTLAPARAELTSVLGSLGVTMNAGWQEQLLVKVHPELLILGGAILGWLGVFLLVIFLILGPRKPLFIALALTALILGHGVSIFGSFIDPRRVANNLGVITAKTAPTLRETPADSATAQGTATPGSLITILSRNGSWWYVDDGSGHLGWIPATTITPLLPFHEGS